jgi:2'-5' RNA ligase
MLLRRFFIGLVPPLEIQAYAEQVIRELHDRYQTYTAKAPPHVTLQAPFEWSLQQESNLTECLSAFAAQQAIVPVSLSGFGAFAPRVLYINVLQTPELLGLQSALRLELETALEIVDSKSRQRSFAPHLTVASRNVTRQSFQQAWAELQSRSVELAFVARCLTLLLHDGQRWQVHTEFPLAGSALDCQQSLM